jgi:hypothetical protein
MQSPSDHFLRAINTDFDRIIAMCKNLQVSAKFILIPFLPFIFNSASQLNGEISLGRKRLKKPYNRMIKGIFHQ